MSLPTQDVQQSVEQFQFLSAPPAWVIVLVIVPALAAFVWLVYRREARSASLRARAVMALLRLAALALVLFILFQPVMLSQEFSVVRSIVALLVDESASMDRQEEYPPELAERLAAAAGLPAGEDPSGLSRAELIRRVFSNPKQDVLGRLEEQVDVQLYGFSTQARHLADVNEVQATGDATAIGDSLLDVLNELRHKNLAGLVLVSDGQSNRGQEVLDVARDAASEGIPIHAIGVGDPARPRNVAVLEVTAPDVALVNDEVAVEVTLNAEGYDGQPAELRVTERGSGEVLVQNTFRLADGGDQQVETAYFKPEREGDYVLEVSVPVLPGEQFADDNTRTHHLRVDPEVIKVLYVEGRPRWEYRFLKEVLLRAKNFKVQVLATWTSPEVIQDSTEGVPALTRFPPTAQDLFAYDVIILGDVAPDAIDRFQSRGTTEALLAELRQFVELGGGLIMVAGELNAPRAYRDSPVADVLPVEIGNPAETQAEVQDQRPYRPHLPDPLRPHDVLRLEKDPKKNRDLLEDPEVGLPPQRWYAPVRRAKPGAEVILEHPTNSNRFGPHVLMAATQYGDGRTLFVGFDETWLWRKPYEDRYTERFWRAAVRHVAIGKLRRSDKRYDLRTDKDRYNLGDLMQLSLRVLDQDFQPSQEANQIIRMQRGEGEVEDLLAYRQEEGTYQRTVRADLPGSYRFWVEPPDESGRHLSQRTVEVQVPRMELLNPNLDAARMKGIASLTGGVDLGLHQVDRLPDLIKGDSRRIPIRTEQRELWDRWEVLAALLLLLTLEWALRKRANLL